LVAPSSEIWTQATLSDFKRAAEAVVDVEAVGLDLDLDAAGGQNFEKLQDVGYAHGLAAAEGTYGIPISAIWRARLRAWRGLSSSFQPLSGRIPRSSGGRAVQRLVSCQARKRGAP